MSLSISISLKKAVEQLSNSDSPRLDAEILLCHILNVTRSHFLAWPDKILTENQSAQFQSLLNRRVQGVPIAYLIGSKAFWSFDLQVNENTLIPRPDTELLVEQVLARLPPESDAQVIDLGTGSGAIALAIAEERPYCRLLATDNSTLALQVAQANAQRLGCHQIQFLLSDWWRALGEIKATIIVSNPPYVAENDRHLTQGDVYYEPRNALVAGVDGLTEIRALIKESIYHLETKGWLLLEHGYDQGKAVRQLFEQQGYKAVETYHDLAGLARVTVGQAQS
jgi:release factor glutamine methyltransferase